LAIHRGLRTQSGCAGEAKQADCCDVLHTTKDNNKQLRQRNRFKLSLDLARRTPGLDARVGKRPPGDVQSERLLIGSVMRAHMRHPTVLTALAVVLLANCAGPRARTQETSSQQVSFQQAAPDRLRRDLPSVIEVVRCHARRLMNTGPRARNGGSGTTPLGSSSPTGSCRRCGRPMTSSATIRSCTQFVPGIRGPPDSCGRVRREKVAVTLRRRSRSQPTGIFFR
jgi:hypothetical protein